MRDERELRCEHARPEHESLGKFGVALALARGLKMGKMNLSGSAVRAIGGVNALAALAALSPACTTLASGSDTAIPAGQVPDDPKWGCLVHPIDSVPVPTPAPMAALYSVPVFDFIAAPAPVPGLGIRVCRVGVYSCDMPVGQLLGPPTNQATAIDGVPVTVPVYTMGMPYGISSFLRLTAPKYLQTEYYLGGKLVGTPDATTLMGMPQTIGKYIAPITISDADMLAKGIGQTRIAGDGIVAVLALDCQHNPAADVTLTLNVPGVPFTITTGLPSSTFHANGTDTATGAPGEPTDARGVAGFANIDPMGDFRNVTVEGIAPNGMKYGQIEVTVRPDQLTIAMIRPDVSVYGL
jgi:hypothetical protein